MSPIRRTKRPATAQTAIRLPLGIFQRLDKLAARYSRQRPGVLVTRSDVMRALLLRALEQEERDGSA